MGLQLVLYFCGSWLHCPAETPYGRLYDAGAWSYARPSRGFGGTHCCGDQLYAFLDVPIFAEGNAQSERVNACAYKPVE